MRVPTEIVKQRLQTTQNSKMSDIAIAAWKSSGIKGFYIGFGTTLLRDVRLSDTMLSDSY